jgi:hypothetical protein
LIYLFSVSLSVGNQHRPSFDFLSQRLYHQPPIKKRADDEDSHVRTSSMSSTSAPVIPPQVNQKLTRPNVSSANVKVKILFLAKRLFFFIFHWKY